MRLCCLPVYMWMPLSVLVNPSWNSTAPCCWFAVLYCLIAPVPDYFRYRPLVVAATYVTERKVVHACVNCTCINDEKTHGMNLPIDTWSIGAPRSCSSKRSSMRKSALTG